VSVVVPCYQCSSTISRAVESISRQTLLPLQVILVDDCSLDGTLDVLLELQQYYGASWIRIISSKTNGGVANARNIGWNNAQTEFVAFIDADDSWHPHKIEIQYQWMCDHPEIVLTGHLSRREPQYNQQSEDLPQVIVVHEITNGALLRSNCFVTPSVMLRRDIPLRFHLGKRYMEDHLLWMELSLSEMQIFRFEHALCYTYKAAYGESGLSSDLWLMEQAELHNYWFLGKRELLSPFMVVPLCTYSLLKFCRRLLLILFKMMPESI
jgi:glycosyltransferase involved in cell wall biosynthesis